MEIKTSAIVLQTIKYGDSQLIVDFFTEKLGDSPLWYVCLSHLRGR